MKMILKKLKNSRGESLVESLVSILIFTLASILFLTMVNSSARINEAAKAEDEQFQTRQERLEDLPGSGAPQKTLSMIHDTGSCPYHGSISLGDYTVYVVGGSETDNLTAFYPHTESGG